MNNPNIHLLKFSINNWQHLYSLKEAVSKSNADNGNTLSVSGHLKNHPLLESIDTRININFHQIDQYPDYANTPNGDIILGQLNKSDHGLTAILDVNSSVFEELKRNIIEYANIDGIHIVINITIITQAKKWSRTVPADIISLEYAMKGDA